MLERVVNFVGESMNVESARTLAAALRLKDAYLKIAQENKAPLNRVLRKLQGAKILFENGVGKYRKIKAAKKNDKPDLNDFFTQLSEAIDLSLIVMKDIQGDTPTEKSISDLTNLVLKAPDVLKAFEYLNLSSVGGAIPQSLPEIEEKFHSFIAHHVGETFLIDIMEKLKSFSSGMFDADEKSVKEFEALSYSQQEAMLLAYHNINEMIKHLAIWVDDFEERVNIRKGVVFTEISPGLDFSKNPKLAHLTIQSRTLNAFFNEFNKAYKVRLQVLQRRASSNGQREYKTEEMYPFTFAIARAKMTAFKEEVKNYENEIERDNLINESVEEKKARKDRELNKKIWEQVGVDIAEIIEKSKTKAKSEEDVKFLEKVQTDLKNGDSNVLEERRESAGNEEVDEVFICSVLDEIKPHMQAACNIVVIQEQKKIQEIEEKKVKISEFEKQLNTPEAKQYSNFEADAKELNANVLKLVRQAYDEVVGIFKVSGMHSYISQAVEKTPDPNEEESKPFVERFKTNVENVRKHLEQALDEDVYKDYFLTNHNQQTVLPWVGEAGRAYLGAASVAKHLEDADNMMQDKNNTHKNHSPLKNINNIIEVALKGERAAGQVLWAVEGILSNTTVHQAREVIANHKQTIKEFVDMAEKDPWYVFIMGKGLESVKQLGKEDRAVKVLQFSQEFFDYASNKFGYDQKTAQISQKALHKIEGVLDDANNELKDESSWFDMTLYFVRHVREILTILPSLPQVKNSLAKASKDEGLQILSRLNGMLRVLFEYADALEIAFNLKEGYISKQLLTFSNGKSLYAYAQELQTSLNESGYGFSLENIYPYRAALHKNRNQEKFKVTNELNENAELASDLLDEKQKIEDGLCGDIIEKRNKTRQTATEIDGLLANFSIEGKKIREFTAAKINGSKVLIAGDIANQQECDDLFVLHKFIYYDVLKNLRKYNDYLRTRSLATQDPVELKEIERKMFIVNREMAEFRNLLEEFPAEIAYNDSGSKKLSNDEVRQKVQNVMDEISTQISNHAECVKQDEIASGITRLRQLREMTSLTIEQKCELIELEEKVCHLNPNYRKILIDLHTLQTKSADLLVTKKLLEKRTATPPAVKIVNSKIAKSEILGLLDSEINNLKARRYDHYWLFPQSYCNDTLSKLEGLEYLRDRYAHDGYYFKEAINDMQAESSILCSFVTSYYRSFFKKLNKMDLTIGEKERGLYMIDAPKQIERAAPKELTDFSRKLIDNRIHDLQHELDKAYFFKKTKQDKIMLLNALKENLATCSFKEAIRRVRKTHGDTTALLFEGGSRTAKLVKSLEMSHMTKEDMIAKIDAEIIHLNDKKAGFFFFATYRSKRVDERIAALEKFRDGKVLTEDEESLLKRYESVVLEGCEKLRLGTTPVTVRMA